MCLNKQISTISKQSDLIVEENKIVMDIAQCFLLSHKVLLTCKEVDPSLLLRINFKFRATSSQCY